MIEIEVELKEKLEAEPGDLVFIAHEEDLGITALIVTTPEPFDQKIIKCELNDCYTGNKEGVY